MRILFVQESDWLARNAHQQHHLAEMLTLRGHSVTVIDFPVMWRADERTTKWSRRDTFYIAKIHKGAKVAVIRPGIIRLPILDYVSMMWTHYQEIKYQIREWKPDVIVGFGILNAYIASRLYGDIPFIYYWIDVLHELIPFAPLRWIGKWVEKKTLRRADQVLAINKSLGDYVSNLGGVAVGLLGAGVNLERFDPSLDYYKKSTRIRYGVKDDDILLFFMGWVYTFSGITEVVSSMADSDPRIKLLVCGDGDDYQKLFDLRGSLGLEGRVLLPGKLPYSKMPEYIAASDICILPAYPDHRTMRHIVPIKLYEYLAMGKPVIATRIPSVVQEFGGEWIMYVDRPEDVVEAALDISAVERPMEGRDAPEVRSWEDVVDKFEQVMLDLRGYY